MLLPPPAALEIHDPQAAEKWKRFKRAWTHYALATGLSGKAEAVQVATLLTVVGEEAREVFATFGWENVGDDQKIQPVLAQFERYCKNVPFERYRFNCRAQEPGETYDQYRTAHRGIAEGCEFGAITPDEILRDRLVFGIRDTKTREQLLRMADLSLKKVDEVCHQLKALEGAPIVGAVDQKKETKHQDNKSDHQRGNPEPRTNPECWNCGRRHSLCKRENCPAYKKRCSNCHKMNHFAAKCRSGSSTSAHPVDEGDEGDETFQTSTSTARQKLDDSQTVTLRLDSGNYIRFQADTGAQCNVIPLDIYTRATKDTSLTKVSPSTITITAYGGATLPVVGTALLRVWRGDYHCKLDCKLVEHAEIRPLLGRKACLGMKIVSYLDNDAMNKPMTGNASVYALDQPNLLSIQQLKQQYPVVFGEAVGLLEGPYHIRLDEHAIPVQHAPRRVPVALRETLHNTLTELTEQGIIEPVQRPTAWISSLVIVPKKNGKLRLCLDPKDLNQAILREHYPLPTIEEVATRLHGTRVFTVLDVSQGFWHIELDEESSFLTTFYTAIRSLSLETHAFRNQLRT